MDKKAYVSIPHIVVCSKLSMQSKATYAVLMAYVDDTGTACVGLDRLAQCLGVSGRSVADYIKELTDAGVISVSRQGVKRANLYHITDFDGIGVDRSDMKQTSLHCSDAKCASMKQTSLHCSDAKHTSVTNNTKDIIDTVDDIGSKRKEICSSSNAPKKMSHSQRAMLHIEEAKSGKREWSAVTDRDFTLYYIQKHNERFQYKIAFDMYRDVSIVRDVVMKGNQIPRDRMASFIETIIDDYFNTPNRYDRLSFNMLANRTKDIVSLIDSVKKKIEPMERRFKYNQFESDADSGIQDMTF